MRDLIANLFGKDRIVRKDLLPAEEIFRRGIHRASRKDVRQIQITTGSICGSRVPFVSEDAIRQCQAVAITARIAHAGTIQNLLAKQIAIRKARSTFKDQSERVVTTVAVLPLRAGFGWEVGLAKFLDEGLRFEMCSACRGRIESRRIEVGRKTGGVA
jgi:hypothetical protein